MTPSRHPDMLYRDLGSTGEKVSAIGLGGFHLGKPEVDEALAICIVRTAVDEGVTFLDNCWDYNDGLSEIRMGKALRDGYRERVFLMTKVDGRTKREAAKQLDESLRRLQVDCIDLVQHHEVLRFEDPHRIFREGGANEALIEAREAGKLRFIGFTGHKDPAIHLHTLEVAEQYGSRFDAVQMPLSLLDAHYRSFAEHVVPYLVERGIAVLGMKSMAAGYLLKAGVVTPVECLHYALDLPTSVVITGIDSLELLEQALTAVRTFAPLSAERRAELLARTAAAGGDGALEPFKTTSLFDATAADPSLLGEEERRKPTT
ncbi:MAG TPA: aldo/keto reductase [Thermoleophilia bacterium]|nr:aldo/keto reductase [Thermoleophilia bacterium]HQJ98228.1 aldo/keto reductase [Thermoleophilia bacterium]